MYYMITKIKVIVAYDIYFLEKMCNEFISKKESDGNLINSINIISSHETLVQEYIAYIVYTIKDNSIH